jgi:hypothetical protein
MMQKKSYLELHDGPTGGHFGGDTTTHKILREVTIGPLYSRFTCICKEMPRMPKVSWKRKKLAFPLQPVSIEHPFQQWGLDVIGEINPNSSQLHKYILTATYYFTRWTEAIPLKVVNENQVISFLESYIVTRFGVPESLVFDNAKYFLH